MATNQPDRDLLRRLAETEVGEGHVLSVYVNLDPSEFATPPARSSSIRSVVDAAARAAEDGEGDLSHAARTTLREDVGRVRDYLGSMSFEGTHGAAVFAAGQVGLFEALQLPYPVASEVVVNASPYVAPIAEDPEGDWCVVLVNRRDGRLLRGGSDGLREVVRVSDDVHGQHDQGGWSQRRYQRSIDREVTRHVERVARAIELALRRRPFDHLLIGGPEDAYSELCDLLGQELRERVRGRIEVDVENTTEAQVLDAALPLMRERERERHEQLLGRLRERLGRGDRAAAGIDDVLGVLHERRVETLLLDARLSVAGCRCPNCGWLGVGGEGVSSCPMDGTALEPEPDVVELGVDRALAQDARIARFEEEPQIASHGGIAALLRF